LDWASEGILDQHEEYEHGRDADLYEVDTVGLQRYPAAPHMQGVKYSAADRPPE
jgi:hypothetical protein